jgi:hypothetical protein
MFARSIVAVALSLGLAWITGCGPARLDMLQTYQIADDAQILKLDPQPKPQTIRIRFESSQSPVTVLLVKAADAPGTDVEIAMAPTDKAIAFKKGEKTGDFTGEVPANTATFVIIREAKGKTSVKVHITN